MKISDLEKGIPPPTQGSVKYEIVLKNLERMEVGHSFTITLEDTDKVSPRGLGVVIGKFYRQSQKKFKASWVSQGKQIRIWRLQ